MRDVRGDDENVPRLGGKAVGFDEMRPRAFRNDVDFIEIMGVHQKGKIPFVDIDGGADFCRGAALAGDAEARVQRVFKGIETSVRQFRIVHRSLPPLLYGQNFYPILS